MLVDAILFPIQPIQLMPQRRSTRSRRLRERMMSIGLNKSNSIHWPYPEWLKRFRKRQSNNRVILEYYTVFEQCNDEPRDSGRCPI